MLRVLPVIIVNRAITIQIGDRLMIGPDDFRPVSKIEDKINTIKIFVDNDFYWEVREPNELIIYDRRT